jgi:hypothetical protein
MTRQVRVEYGAGKADTAVTARHALLTSSWTASVEALEREIGRFTAPHPRAPGCQVMLFEIEGDDQLHVNVIHARRRSAVRGWSGPGRVAAGCVYNRRFARTAPARIIRHIREMVFA